MYIDVSERAAVGVPRSIGIGEVLDQRIDASGCRRGIEGDSQCRTCTPPIAVPMSTPPKVTSPAAKPICPAPEPSLRMLTMSSANNPDNNQRTADEIVVGIGKYDIRVETLRRQSASASKE